MDAVNLTLRPVELDPINGSGLLAPADEHADGADRRTLTEVTPREEALAEAGVIALEGDPPKDRYDAMDREALQKALDAHDPPLTAERADGRTDREPTLEDLRHTLRVADITNGGDA